MSTKDYSAELLKMEGVQIEKLDETEEEILLQISMERKMHICKRCGGETDRIHDYRVREVRDLELRGKPVRLLYRLRLPGLREALFGDQRLCRALYALYPSHRRKNHGTAAPAQQHEGHREGHGNLRQRRERLNPKFCVNSQRGENRSEFIVSGSGFIRLPLVCSITPAGMDVKGGGKAAVHRSAVQRRADP